MRKIGILFIILANLGLAVFALQTSAEEGGLATLSLVPSADNFIVGSEFEVAVILDSGGQAINVIDVIVYFPEDLIEVVGSPTRDGLLPLWQFNASNEKGEINIVGGERQNGVVASDSEITRIRFKVIKEGKAILQISKKNSNIIVADGFGTKIPVKAGGAYYSLTTGPVIVETSVVIPLDPEAGKPTPTPLKEELGAMALNFIEWSPGQLSKIPIMLILKTNLAGLFVALVAIIYNARKKKPEIQIVAGK